MIPVQLKCVSKYAEYLIKALTWHGFRKWVSAQRKHATLVSKETEHTAVLAMMPIWSTYWSGSFSKINTVAFNKASASTSLGTVSNCPPNPKRDTGYSNFLIVIDSALQNYIRNMSRWLQKSETIFGPFLTMMLGSVRLRKHQQQPPFKPTFWLLQAITGHSVFTEFLHHIDRRTSPSCHCNQIVANAEARLSKTTVVLSANHHLQCRCLN